MVGEQDYQNRLSPLLVYYIRNRKVLFILNKKEENYWMQFSSFVFYEAFL